LKYPAWQQDIQQLQLFFFKKKAGYEYDKFEYTPK
jgi:hypothetical protein